MSATDVLSEILLLPSEERTRLALAVAEIRPREAMAANAPPIIGPTMNSQT